MGIEKVYEAAFFLQVFAYHGVSSHKLTFQSRYSHQRNSEIASSKWRLRCKNGHTYLFEDKTGVVIVKFREVFVVIICSRCSCTTKEAAQHFDFLGLAFSFRLTCSAHQHLITESHATILEIVTKLGEMMTSRQKSFARTACAPEQTEEETSITHKLTNRQM